MMLSVFALAAALAQLASAQIESVSSVASNTVTLRGETITDSSSTFTITPIGPIIPTGFSSRANGTTALGGQNSTAAANPTVLSTVTSGGSAHVVTLTSSASSGAGSSASSSESVTGGAGAGSSSGASTRSASSTTTSNPANTMAAGAGLGLVGLGAAVLFL